MVVTKIISLQSKGNCDIIDITSQVEQQVTEANINSGTATLFVAGSTAGLSTIEYEPGLISDFQSMWERNIPKNIPYDHDRRWGDGNGYAHVRAAFFKPCLTLPLTDGRLELGTWQQIVLLDFDNRPRRRRIRGQVMGQRP